MLLNTLENHPSIFTFAEIYHISVNAIKDYESIQIKVFETRIIKSWFMFLSTSARSKWLEDILNTADLIDEKETLCDRFLHSTTYKDTIETHFREDYEDAEARYKVNQKRKELERKQKRRLKQQKQKKKERKELKKRIRR